MLTSMGLEEDIEAALEAAGRFAGPDEQLVGAVPTEPADGGRVYLCAYARGEERRWLALDEAGRPVEDRRVVRDAASIAALCELAEETAGGGDVDALRASLAELRETENPEGIEEAEAAAARLAAAILPEPRLASLAYLDAIGAAAADLERSLGGHGSPFAEAMKVGMGAADELAGEVESAHKTALA
jgi:hypothetical protein